MADFQNPLGKKFPDPMYLEGVSGNPYDNIGEAYITGNSSPAVAKLIELTHDVLIPEQRARTVITTEKEELGNVAGVLTEMGKLVLSRLGQNEEFFAATHTGTTLWRSPNVRALDRGYLDLIGGFNSQIGADLGERRDVSQALEKQNLRNVISLINLPENGLLIETGAGADYRRITTLWEHALERKGQLICHDLPLLAGTVARGNIPEDVPYIPISGGRSYFGALLKESNVPTVVSLNNVITTFGLSDARALMENCRGAGADIVISQSLKFGHSSSMFPVGYEIERSGFGYDQNLENYVIRVAPELARNFAPEQFGEAFVAIGVQSKETISQMMLESMVGSIRGLGRHKFGYNVYVAAVTDSETAKKDEALTRFDEHSAYRLLLTTPGCNHMQVGFSHTTSDRDPALSESEVKISTERLYIVLSKDKRANPFGELRGSVRSVGVGEYITPVEDLALKASDFKKQWPEYFSNLNDAQLDICARLGRAFGFLYVTKLLPKLPGGEGIDKGFPVSSMSRFDVNAQR